MIYKIRAILDVEENVIRDIAIQKTDTLEDLHNSISNAFGYDGSEMASFYLADNEWNQGEEFPLFDMSDVPGEVTQMREIAIADVLSKVNDKLIYVYDFFNMWTFFVELMEANDEEPEGYLPHLLFSLGEVPANAPEKLFDGEIIGGLNPGDDDDDDFDYEEFDDNWN
ncbi:MAG: hypothetical protein ABFR05_09780 [Bacteroidota bacterium]